MPDLEKEKFICLDCETTGLDVQQDRIIEVAVMCFDAQQVYAQMETLINPECDIPESSIAIHHITADMVKDQPLIVQVLPDILKLIGNYTIIGHGVGFDIELLALAAERYGIPCHIRQNRRLDTLRMARLYGGCDVNSLESLCRHFNIPVEDVHRAMGDVIMNRQVFKFLSKGFKNTEALFRALDKPILMKIMPLGKHKGRLMKEVPLQFLQWVARQDYFDQDLLYSARTEINRRKQGNSFHQAGNPFLNL